MRKVAGEGLAMKTRDGAASFMWLWRPERKEAQLTTEIAQGRWVVVGEGGHGSELTRGGTAVTRVIFPIGKEEGSSGMFLWTKSEISWGQNDPRALEHVVTWVA